MTQLTTVEKQVVFVVDDDASVRRSLVRLLASVGLVARPFASAEKFLSETSGAASGCIILDVQMGGMDGISLQRRLGESDSHLPIIFLTGHGDIPMSVEAMKHGAEDFLIKPVDDETLLAAVKRALDRSRERMCQFGEEEDIRRRIDLLSPREREVMRCLLTGALNKQIGAHLGIVEKTVKVHRARVLEKMGVQSVAELVWLCGRIGETPAEM